MPASSDDLDGQAAAGDPEAMITLAKQALATRDTAHAAGTPHLVADHL
jgi:hypothetical protein